MQKRIAVIAHFDVDDKIDENFFHVIVSLEKVFDGVVFVTTSNIPAIQCQAFHKTTMIVRPNIGYDFYSYKVGIEYASKAFGGCDILLVNSSFFVSDSQKFERLLCTIIKEAQSHDVVGLTGSHQIAWHAQSYLLMLTEKVLAEKEVKDFFRAIVPLNSKFEVILNYEIGLSTLLRAQQYDVHLVFKPDMFILAMASARWGKVVMRDAPFKAWLSGSVIKSLKGINWTHFGAEHLARQFGIVKAEILRTNPHGLPIDFMPALTMPSLGATINESLRRSARHYRVSADGLSALTTSEQPLPSYRSVQYRPIRGAGVRVAVVIHLYYYDLLDEILSYLRNIIEPFDLFVTTPHERDVENIINCCADVAKSITVRLSENRGRDIGPFMALYLDGALDHYAAVLKLHSKKSTYSASGDFWRRKLYGALLGNSLIVRRILKMMGTGGVGIIGPHEFYLSNGNFWGANRLTVQRILHLCGALEKDAAPELGFFAGSMFWFAPQALRSLKSLPLSEFSFEPERGMQDGTLAHALERVFCPVARAAGYTTSSVALEGSEINAMDCSENRVPVL
jgi:rhamnosyltransferase